MQTMQGGLNRGKPSMQYMSVVVEDIVKKVSLSWIHGYLKGRSRDVREAPLNSSFMNRF